MESKQRKLHSVKPLKALIYIHGTGSTHMLKNNIHINTQFPGCTAKIPSLGWCDSVVCVGSAIPKMGMGHPLICDLL